MNSDLFYVIYMLGKRGVTLITATGSKIQGSKNKRT